MSEGDIDAVLGRTIREADGLRRKVAAFDAEVNTIVVRLKSLSAMLSGTSGHNPASIGPAIDLIDLAKLKQCITDRESCQKELTTLDANIARIRGI